MKIMIENKFPVTTVIEIEKNMIEKVREKFNIFLWKKEVAYTFYTRASLGSVRGLLGTGEGLTLKGIFVPTTANNPNPNSNSKLNPNLNSN
jgi:hypothetical protein